MRLLKANEIEVRVGQCKDKGLSLLLYKNARVDMQILDETYGPMNWKRDHAVINGNNYCTVSVWNEKTNQWVSKSDCGTESNTEKEKGEASDSFKRACVNWGIGRELYTSPFIWVTNADIKTSNSKSKTFDKFKVAYISYNDDREINGLKIVNQKNAVVFEFKTPVKQVAPGAPPAPKIDANMIKSLHTRITSKGITDAQKKDYLKKNFNLESSKDLNVTQYKKMMNDLAKMPDKKYKSPDKNDEVAHMFEQEGQ